MDTTTYTAFSDHHLVATGTISDVALKTKAWLDQGQAPVIIFEDQSGQQIEIDLRGTPDEALERLQEHPWLRRFEEAPDKRTGPGRPKLGVVSREVSLLPRHWEWLNGQRGGASVTLRKLVEERMRQGQAADRARRAFEAASKFMWAMAGNLPAFEEASRAFSRKDYDLVAQVIEAWPTDIRDHVRRLVATTAQAEKEAADEPQA